MAWNDLRFGLRMLAQQPGFTAVAVLTLALGIGANTAMFTLFNAILLQSLPVRDPARLVLFNDGLGDGTRTTPDLPQGQWTLFSFPSYEFLRAQNLPFEGLAAVRSGESTVSVRLTDTAGHQAQRAQAHPVSGNYFAVMGVDAALGRTLSPDDDRPNAAPVAVVSYGFWSDRLHADASLVGKTLVVNSTAFTIVGVTPREFFGESVRRPPDVWVPLVFQPQIELRPSYLNRTDAYWLRLIGRLKPGATRVQAQSAATIALQHFLTDLEGAKLSDDVRRQIKDCRVELSDGAGGLSGLRYRYSEPLRMLLVVVALVLALACANVGNLLLSRAAARKPELTVRMALGAGRGRIVRQLFTESALLAMLGAICGVLLARWAVSVLLALMASKTTPVHASLDGRVLAFTIVVTLAAAVLFGLAPALSGSRADLVTAIKGGARGAVAGRGRLTQALVVAQIAISLVLLVGAGLFARSLFNLEQQPLGFDQDHVLLARLNPRLAGYQPETVTALYRRLYDRIAALPGIRSATIARYSPLGGSRSVNSGVVEGYAPKTDETVEFETQIVGPSYPETLGMPLVRGRAIGIQDSPAAPKVAMVNESFVRHFVGDENPIGRHFGGFGRLGPRDIEIVGVLRDARFQNDNEPIRPVVFTALLQEVSQFALDVEVEVRTVGEPASAAGVLRQAIAEVDANLPINDPKTLRDQVRANFDSQRLAAELVGAFGVLALLLASVGLYGVVTQGVVRRTNEIGVRMALGAERRDVLWMVLSEIVVLLAVGLGIGIPAAFAASRLVASQLYGVGAAAPVAFGFAVVTLTIVALVTGFLPARRASRVDPIVALRYE